MTATILAAAVPAAAKAEPTFDTFHELCLSGADAKAALAMADTKGWKPIPKAQLGAFPSFTKGGSPPVVDGRVDGSLGSPSMKAALIVGHAARIDEKLDLGSDLCVVAAPTENAAALKAEVAKYAQVPALQGVFDEARITAFAWRDGPDGRKPVSAGEIESPAALGAKILVAEAGPGFAFIGLLTPTK